MIFKRRKIVIGIHGLGNKPPRRLLRKWWKRSIQEGLKNLTGRGRFFRFRLTYWAQLMYPQPLNLEVENPDSPLYLGSPYVPGDAALKKERIHRRRKRLLGLLERAMDLVSFKAERIINIDSISDYVIKTLYRELYIYYQDPDAEGGGPEYRAARPDEENSPGTPVDLPDTREAIRRTLRRDLIRYRKRKILLVAHSMGTIIAFDVLNELADQISVDTFITIGSPLGLPFIVKRILKEQKIDFRKQNRPRTPEAVRKHWYNFSDLNDRVALNYNLGDDFMPNSQGVRPVDYQVQTDYEYQGLRDHHKSYGYLRTPECSRAIREFLDSHEIGMMERLSYGLDQLRDSLKKRFGSRIG